MKLMYFFLLAPLIFSCTALKEESDTLPDIYNGGAKINYQIEGEGDTTLLFVHGWCINKSYWHPQVEFFKSRYTILTLDLPGHGQSGKNRKDWSIKNFGGDVVLIMDALDLRNVVLIGHSMGGDVILEAAIRRPGKVAGFVGVDNFKEAGVEYTMEQLAEMEQFVAMIREDYQNAVSGFAERMLFAESTSSAVEQRVMDDILNTPPDISAGIIESLFEVGKSEQSLMQLLPVKVHLINSDGIPTNEGQLKKYCKNSYDVHSIGLTGHYPMIEAPEKFNEILGHILENL